MPSSVHHVRQEAGECSTCGALLVHSVCPSCTFDELFPEVDLTERDRKKSGQLNMAFGHYTLKERLAAGGMGVVYLANDHQLNRMVALKMIRASTFANEAEIARFTVEAKAAAALDHPNITPVYEVGTIEEQPFFTMKLIEGESLAARLKSASDHKLDPRQAAAVLSKIAHAVHHAHQRGILHRDLKPGNILLDQEDHPWLTDFGLAKLLDRDNDLTRSTDSLGTPNYMAPEVIEGSAKAVATSTDVWALGVILWEALCGESPFRSHNAIDVMRRIAEEEPSLNASSGVDRDLRTLAQRCLEKDPKRRIGSAGEVAEELDRWLRGEPLLVRPVTSGERLWKWVKRKPVWAALALTLLLAGITSLLSWQRAEKAVESLTQSNAQLAESLAISTATKLAMNARLQIDEDPACALLLAAESVEMTEQVTGKVLPEAAEALYRTLQRVGGEDISPRGAGRMAEDKWLVDRFAPHEFPLVYSPDGRYLLAFEAPFDRAVKAAVFDLEAGGSPELLARWPLWETRSVSKAACWSADSQSLVTVDPDASVRCWSPTAKMERLDELPPMRLLGNLKRLNESLCRAWLRPAPNSSVLHGIAVYQSTISDTALTLVSFVVDLQHEGSVSVSNEWPFVDLKEPFINHWVMSPSHKWLYFRRHQDAYLARLDGEVEWARIPDVPGHMIESRFSSNERWLIGWSDNNEIVRFDLQQESLPAIVDSQHRLIEHEVDIDTFALSSDGKRLALADSLSEVLIVSTDDPADVTWLGGGESEGWLRLRFSENGRWLAGGGMGQTVTLWPIDPDAKRYVGRPTQLTGIGAAVIDVFFAPGGRAIAAYGNEAHFRQWSLEGEPGSALPIYSKGLEGPIVDLAFSADEEWCAVARRSGRVDRSGAVILTKLDSAQEYHLGTHKGDETSVAFSKDGRWLASAGRDGVAMLWDFFELKQMLDKSVVPSPKYRFDMTDTRLFYERQLAFHPSGLLYCTSGDGILFEWNLLAADPVASRKKHRLHSNGYLLPDVSVSQDGRWLAVARHGWDPPSPQSLQSGNMVLLYDVSVPDRMEFVAALPANFREVTSIDISNDGRWLAAGANDLEATVWDLQAADIEKSRRVSHVDDPLLKAVGFSPDARWLGLGGSDGRLHLWDWQSGETRTISTKNSIGTLTWRHGSELVSGDSRGLIKVWQIDTDILKKQARDLAGRSLSELERARFNIR